MSDATHTDLVPIRIPLAGAELIQAHLDVHSTGLAFWANSLVAIALGVAAILAGVFGLGLALMSMTTTFNTMALVFGVFCIIGGLCITIVQLQYLGRVRELRRNRAPRQTA